MKNYKIISLILLAFLFLNIAYNLNAYSFKQDILETMTYQTFKDLKMNEDINKDEAKINIANYIDKVLAYELNKRNDIVDTMLGINIFIIIIFCFIWLFHYFYIQKNKKQIFIRFLLVLSTIWLLIMFPKSSYSMKEFVNNGILPIIIVFGTIWVYFAYSKNKEQ